MIWFHFNYHNITHSSSTSALCKNFLNFKFFFGPYFSAVGLITEIYEVNLCIQSECEEIQTRKAAIQRCPQEKVFWKYAANLQENTQANFIEITLRHGCSPVHLLHILRTPLPKNNSERLPLNIDIMMFKADKVTIFVPELLKQSRSGHHLAPMVLLR